jgi:SSS family solute:Na+ symporter
MTLSPFAVDAVVIAAYFALIVGVGLWMSRGKKSLLAFALGNRQTPWWAVLASILAAEISAATFLGAPESGYTLGNWTYAQFAIGTVLARIIVSFVFIPVYYKHGVISLYEYLGTRFGPRTRHWASATFLLTRVLAMGTRLYVSAIIIVLAWQIWRGAAITSSEKFWIFGGAVVLVTLLTAIYTTAGGIRAVIWTDFIQVGVLAGALVFSIWFLLSQLPGGWSTAVRHMQTPLFFNFAKPSTPGAGPWLRNVLISDYTIWAALIGATFVTMASHGIDQDTVQRMLTAKSKGQSAKATILSGVLDLPIVCSFILVGILVSAFYKSTGASLPADIAPREVFPYFILTRMPAGLRGLVIAGILATAMGSLSTALNALATSFARDFVLPRRELRGRVSESERVRVLRWSTVGFAALIIVVGLATAFYMANDPNAAIIPLVLGILGYTFGSLLAVFFVAVFTKTRGNDFGNVIAMICGFVSVVFLSSADIQRLAGFPILVLAFPWRITLGATVTFLISICFPTYESGALRTK